MKHVACCMALSRNSPQRTEESSGTTTPYGQVFGEYQEEATVF